MTSNKNHQERGFTVFIKLFCFYRNTPNRRHIFLTLILKISVKLFRPTLGAFLIGDFSRTITKNLSFIVHFLPVLNDCLEAQLSSEMNIILGNYRQVRTSAVRQNRLRNKRSPA